MKMAKEVFLGESSLMKFWTPTLNIQIGLGCLCLCLDSYTLSGFNLVEWKSMHLHCHGL
jgi:hypothetical protein